MKTGSNLLLILLLVFGTQVQAQRIAPYQSVQTERKVVALTFDDGPCEDITLKILDLLDTVDGKATFFNTGKSLKLRSELAMEVIERGHEIGNHSLNHKKPSAFYGSNDSLKEIIGFQKLSDSLLNYQPKLYRAPFLKYDSLSGNKLAKIGLKAVNASVYAKDARENSNAKNIVKRVMDGIHPGAIVLFHERPHTIMALQELLPMLQSEGYEFVSVSDLLTLEKNSITAKHPYIKIAGSNYAHMNGDVMVFPRHSATILAMSKGKSKFSSQKAKTTTGIRLSFATASPKVRLSFKRMPGENRGSVFGVYQDKKFVKAMRFTRNDGPDLYLEIESEKEKKEVLYEITLPNWSNIAFKELVLDKGYKLKELSPDNRPIYVAYGNSITHGTGQQASYQTYPFLVANHMNWQLFNLAVGGGKTSLPMAEMIRDDFDRIDYMTILIGYNDFNGEGISAKEYKESLQNFVSIIREKHGITKLFCITPTYTKTEISKKSGERISDFRMSMEQVVKEFQEKGDSNIFLIRGEEISKAEDLKDAVHFTVKGAKSFGELLIKEIEKKRITNN